MKVAGLDLSTTRIGYAATSGELFSITARAGASDPYRRIFELLRNLQNLQPLTPKPDLVVIEGYAHHSPGAFSLIRLAELGGVIRLWLFTQNVPFELVAPTELKRFATGKGNAHKEEMVAAAISFGAPAGVNHDEADAFHLRRMGLSDYFDRR